VKKYLLWGAGPRAGQFMILASKARAFMLGKPNVAQEDLEAVAMPVLRHRLVVNFTAEAERVTSDQIIHKLVELVKKQK
jgi:MoxR-like ATPase